MPNDSEIERAVDNAAVRLILDTSAALDIIHAGAWLSVVPHGTQWHGDGARALGVRLTANMTPTLIERAIRRALPVAE